jgi:hypothetical protein
VSNFCRVHAFYEPCPACAGETLEWVIPVYRGSEKTGEMRIALDGDTEVLGFVDLPWQEPAIIAPLTIIPPPEPGDPELARKLDEALGASLYSKMLEEPRHREAAARGRKVHEDALVLVDKDHISYEDAIERVLEK